MLVRLVLFMGLVLCLHCTTIKLANVKSPGGIGQFRGLLVAPIPYCKDYEEESRLTCNECFIGYRLSESGEHCLMESIVVDNSTNRSDIPATQHFNQSSTNVITGSASQIKVATPTSVHPSNCITPSTGTSIGLMRHRDLAASKQ